MSVGGEGLHRRHECVHGGGLADHGGVQPVSHQQICRCLAVAGGLPVGKSRAQKPHGRGRDRRAGEHHPVDRMFVEKGGSGRIELGNVAAAVGGHAVHVVVPRGQVLLQRVTPAVGLNQQKTATRWLVCEALAEARGRVCGRHQIAGEAAGGEQCPAGGHPLP
jgi:hypothetical protein